MQVTDLMVRLCRNAALCAAVVILSGASRLSAAIDINFTGMDLVYDGSALYDANTIAGGLANPADADPLTAVVFSMNGTTVGTLTSDIYLDVFIPDITGIPASANAIDVQTTPGNPGFFDLLIGSSPLASEFLLADLEEVTITYLDGSSTAQFNFGAALTDTFAANLPFGLQIDDPITISFSAQVVAGTRTDDGTFITGFDARGTGEYSGAVVPEPSTGLLVLLTAAGLSLRRR